MRNMMTVVTCAAFVALSARTFTQSKAEAPAIDKASKSRGLTEVAGIKVGHHTLTERPTGCTVILTPTGTTGGVDVRGGAPGTRETDLLSPVNDVANRECNLALGRKRLRPRRRTRCHALPRGAQHRISGRTHGRADRAGGDPLRSRIRRRLEDPSDRRLRLQSGHRRERRPRGGRQCRRGCRRDHRQDGRPEHSDEGRARISRDHDAERPRRGGARRRQRRRRRDRSDDRPGRRGRANGDGKRSPMRGSSSAPARSCSARRRAPARTRRSGSSRPTRSSQRSRRRSRADGARRLRARDLAGTHAGRRRHDLLARDRCWDGEANLAIVGALAAEAMADAIVRAVTQNPGLSGVPSARELGTVPARFK